MSTSRTLREEANQSAPWLFEQAGFEVVHETYISGGLAATLTLRSPRLLILFDRDRGFVSTKVACLKEQPQRWWDADFVLEVAKNLPIRPTCSTFDEGAALVRDNLAELSQAMEVDYKSVAPQLERRSWEKLDANRRGAREWADSVLKGSNPQMKKSFWRFWQL